MKNICMAIVMIIALAAATPVRAEDKLGVGIIIGEPTGISVKSWLSHERALDFAAAWSFAENDSFQFHADYLIHNFSLLHSGSVGGKLPLYYGIGGRIKLAGNSNEKGRNSNDALLGVRVPVGISYLFAKAPVDLFVEIVPVLDVVPATDFGINAAIGARFYFR